MNLLLPAVFIWLEANHWGDITASPEKEANSCASRNLLLDPQASPSFLSTSHRTCWTFTLLPCNIRNSVTHTDFCPQSVPTQRPPAAPPPQRQPYAGGGRGPASPPAGRRSSQLTRRKPASFSSRGLARTALPELRFLSLTYRIMESLLVCLPFNKLLNPFLLWGGCKYQRLCSFWHWSSWGS